MRYPLQSTGILTPAAYARLWIVGLLIVAAVYLLCMMLDVTISPTGEKHVALAWPSNHDIFDIRQARILPAALVGFALAGAGVALQALLRNPLADPYILGISSGSSVAVILWELLFGKYIVQNLADTGEIMRAVLSHGAMFPSAAGALLTCLLVFAVARFVSRRDALSTGGGVDPSTLLLTGVVISAMNAALVMLMNSLFREGAKQGLQHYLVGSISNDVTRPVLWLAAAAIGLCYLPILLASSAINIASLSDLEARSLGVRVARLRTLTFFSASIMTAAAVMLAGPIGFVGLICPHVCRSLVGPDHRRLTVAAPLAGAAFLMLADSLARASLAFLPNGELPVGVVTALCGGPFFLLLLRQRSSITP